MRVANVYPHVKLVYACDKPVYACDMYVKILLTRGSGQHTILMISHIQLSITITCLYLITDTVINNQC